VINRRKGETTMAFTAMLSELYNAFRHRVGGDEAAAKAVAENQPFNGLKRGLDQRYEALTQVLYQVEVLSRATDQRLGAFGQTMEQRFDALSQRFDVLSQPFDELKRELDRRFDALSQAMDQRFDALSQRFDVLSQPFDELKRELDQRFDALSLAMDQRFDALSRRFDGLNQPFVELSRALQQRTDALNHSVNQRLDVLSRAMDERFAFGQTMDQRFDAFGHRLDAMGRTIDERFGTEAQRFNGMDVQLARLETNVARMWLEQQAEVAKAPTKFHYLEWTLGILLGLMLGFGAKVIFDWGVPTTLFRGLWQN
jgi:DNA anti-recombination protein RmuC